jgi:hypothetical protein
MKNHGKKQKPTLKAKPVNVYTSTCCQAVATKPPCLYLGMRTKEAETQGLGSWRCSNCHKPCTCTRAKISLDKSPDVAIDLSLTRKSAQSLREGL